MTKKLIALLLCLCMAVSLFTACGNKSEVEDTVNNPVSSDEKEPAASEESKPVENEPVEEAAKHVEVLRIGTTYANESFSVWTTAGAFGRMNYHSFTNLCFWSFDENNELSTEGTFFNGWEINEDNTVLTLNYDLTDLYWHDGTPVSDDDVLFTMNFWTARNYPLFLHFTNVEVLETGKIQLTFDSPMAFSFLNQTCQMYFIMPEHIWGDVEDPASYDAEDKSIGCGPFKLVAIDNDAQVSYYEAVENYPLGEITVDKVELHSYDNEASLIQAMINNEIDVMYGYSDGLDTTLLPLIENIPEIDPGQSLNSATYQMMFGFNQYPTDQLPIRQAVSYALDYELLCSTLGGDYGQIASTGAVSPACLGYDASLPANTRDLEKAMQVLDEAGYIDVDGDGFRELPDGEQMSIRIGLQSTSDLYKRNAEIIQTNLAEVGIRAVVDEETIANADYRTEQRMQGLYDIWLSMTTSGMATWGGVAKYAAAVTITSGQRFGTYADPTYLAAYDAMEASRNYDEYIAAFQDIQRMNSEDIPVIAFAIESIFFPYRTDAITGWNNYPARGVINTSTWYNAVAK